MDTLHNIKAFLATARTGSFSEAARQTGVAPSVITKRIDQLEWAIKGKLFQRSTRKLALTTDGERLYGQVRLPWRDIGEALTDLRQGAGKPAGTMKADTPLAPGPPVRAMTR